MARRYIHFPRVERGQFLNVQDLFPFLHKIDRLFLGKEVDKFCFKANTNNVYFFFFLDEPLRSRRSLRSFDRGDCYGQRDGFPALLRVHAPPGQGFSSGLRVQGGSRLRAQGHLGLRPLLRLVRPGPSLPRRPFDAGARRRGSSCGRRLLLRRVACRVRECVESDPQALYRHQDQPGAGEARGRDSQEHSPDPQQLRAHGGAHWRAERAH